MLRDRAAPDSRTARSAWTSANLSVRVPIAGQAIFAELWDCPVAAAGLIKNNINMNTNWCPHV
jgi:hypothetical protein